MKKMGCSKYYFCLIVLLIFNIPNDGQCKELFSKFSPFNFVQTSVKLNYSQIIGGTGIPIKTIEFTSSMMQPSYSNKEKGQHLFGKYIITLMGSVGLWNITVAVSSLIDNGTPSPSREWFEDNFGLIVRPSLILGSTTISMLLFKHKNFRTFISLLALNSAVLTTAYFGGRHVSDEAGLLLQLTATFFVVPLISTLYNNSFPERKSIKVGQLQINFPEPSIQLLDKKLWIGGRIGFQW